MRAPLVLLAVSALLAGCAGGTTWTTSTEPDHFRLEARSGGSTFDEEMAWETRGGDLRVNVSLEGNDTARLTLRDARGQTVLSQSLGGADGVRERETNLTGVPAGTWTVHARAPSLDGTLRVRIDRVGP